MICRKAKGNRICQHSAISWSMRSRGTVTRIHMKNRMKADVLVAMRAICSHVALSALNGQIQPPRKISEANAEIRTRLTNSAI